MQVGEDPGELVADSSIAWELLGDAEVLEGVVEHWRLASRPGQVFIEDPKVKSLQEPFLSGDDRRAEPAFTKDVCHDAADDWEVVLGLVGDSIVCIVGGCCCLLGLVLLAIAQVRSKIAELGLRMLVLPECALASDGSGEGAYPMITSEMNNEYKRDQTQRSLRNAYR